MRDILYNEDKVYVDQGVFFGKGAFETIAYYDKPVLLDYHIERLKKALDVLNMDQLEEKKLREFIDDKLSLHNTSFKITVTDKNIIISTRPIPYTEDMYRDGFNLTVSEVRRNKTSRLTYIKSCCYYENILQKQEAVKKGYNDLIFLNEEDKITETSCANIFFVKDKKIYTPKVSEGLLEGVIRRWIMDNYEVIETSIDIEDISEYDEVFITNSLMGIMKVSKINNTSYNNGEISSIIRKDYENTKIN
ncbi:aminotransferase class IV [Clostridium sp. MSJ-8]|uniref:aminotransferase class IV n=1 Tax=Clostridium sp. MSJ-8 TaxID=2841510 RepID=UPI001C0F157E|nr:aminotransferase class IV [Clostridium sp. MSJ-8]MBU5487855.1 aminotransferase class IV [Clostridium sp. MSJ-8]